MWKHSSYTYAIPWCFKIWAWLRHEFLESAIPWWSTSKFWPRHELGMNLSFDCTGSRPWPWSPWERLQATRAFQIEPKNSYRFGTGVSSMSFRSFLGLLHVMSCHVISWQYHLIVAKQSKIMRARTHTRKSSKMCCACCVFKLIMS